MVPSEQTKIEKIIKTMGVLQCYFELNPGVDIGGERRQCKASPYTKRVDILIREDAKLPDSIILVLTDEHLMHILQKISGTSI